MVETAAHLVDHVFPQLPVRQWVLSLRKRLRYFLRHDRRTVTAVLTIFLRVVEQVLRERAPGAAPKARLGAVSFVHRFGSALNDHVHFHCCVIDGVFEPDQGGDEAVRFREAVFTDADVQRGEPRPNVQWTFAARRTTGQDVRAGACLERWSLAKDGLHGFEWRNGGGFCSSRPWDSPPSLGAGAKIRSRRIFRSMPRCGSRPMTGPGSSGCCATVPARRSPWSGSRPSTRTG